MLHLVRHPEVHRDNNTEDKFRWLENMDLSDTKQFITRENGISKEFLESCVIRKEFIETIAELMNFEERSLPQIHAEQYFTFTMSPRQNQRYSMIVSAFFYR